MIDPAEILGISSNANDEEIRVGYLRKIKEFPPDRAPDEFERIRDAYEKLRDPRRRARAILACADAGEPLSSLVAGLAPERRFAGPDPWLEVLKTK